MLISLDTQVFRLFFFFKRGEHQDSGKFHILLKELQLVMVRFALGHIVSATVSFMSLISNCISVMIQEILTV